MSVKVEGRLYNREHTSALTPINPQWWIQTQHFQPGIFCSTHPVLWLSERRAPWLPTLWARSSCGWQTPTALKPQAWYFPMATGTLRTTPSSKGKVSTHDSSCEPLQEPPVPTGTVSRLVTGEWGKVWQHTKKFLCMLDFSSVNVSIYFWIEKLPDFVGKSSFVGGFCLVFCWGFLREIFHIRYRGC